LQGFCVDDTSVDSAVFVLGSDHNGGDVSTTTTVINLTRNDEVTVLDELYELFEDARQFDPFTSCIRNRRDAEASLPGISLSDIETTTYRQLFSLIESYDWNVASTYSSSNWYSDRTVRHAINAAQLVDQTVAPGSQPVVIWGINDNVQPCLRAMASDACEPFDGWPIVTGSALSAYYPAAMLGKLVSYGLVKVLNHTHTGESTEPPWATEVTIPEPTDDTAMPYAETYNRFISDEAEDLDELPNRDLKAKLLRLLAEQIERDEQVLEWYRNRSEEQLHQEITRRAIFNGYTNSTLTAKQLPRREGEGAGRIERATGWSKAYVPSSRDAIPADTQHLERCLTESGYPYLFARLTGGTTA
jgi:hypothetical protein